MSSERAKLGRWGEALAASFLQAHGYQILERNVRTPYGEIDLVARQECLRAGEPVEVTVFVEVKTRRSSLYGLPEEAITPSKQSHLLNAAQAFLLAHPELDGDWRVDVIAIRSPRRDAQPEVIHFENAITGG
jgi:putative endonuclease